MKCYELDILTHLIFIAFINKYFPSGYNTSSTGLEKDKNPAQTKHAV